MSERTDLITRKERLPEHGRELPVVAPVVDIFENEDEILMYANMPGVAKEDVVVNVDNGRLELSGTRKISSSGAAAWEEVVSLEYKRAFSVPQSIDVSRVDAELSEGVLKLHLPKSEAAKPKTIEIR